MKNLVSRINSKIRLLLYWSTAASCALFLVVILYSVLSRYLLKTPMLGSVEWSRLFFVWSCFMAAALCYYDKSHIVITFITDRFSPLFLKAVKMAAYLISIGFFILIGVQSGIVVKVLWETDFPMLGFTQAWLYLPVPVACSAMCLFAIEFLIESSSSSPAKPAQDAIHTNR